MEQDVHRIVILAVVLVLFDKGEELSHLVSADGFPCVGIVDNDLCKFKIKGILADVIILHRHSKSGAKNATDAMDAAVAPSVLLLKLHQECLGNGMAYLLNGQIGKRLFLQDVDHSFISRLGGRFNIDPQGNVKLDQFQNGLFCSLAVNAVKFVSFNLGNLLTQGQIFLFACGGLVGRHEPPGI